MAVAAPITSRRAMLGSFAAASVMAVLPAPVYASTSAWDRALAKYQNGLARRRSYEASTYEPAVRRLPPHPARDAKVFQWFDPIEDEFNRLVQVEHRALLAMMAIPAPHLRSLAEKLEALRNEDIIDDLPSLLAVLASDARRLGADA